MIRRARGALSSVVVSVLLMVPALHTAAQAAEIAGHRSPVEQRKPFVVRPGRPKSTQTPSGHRIGGVHLVKQVTHGGARNAMFVADSSSDPGDKPQVGLASWYGGRHWEGKRTSNGGIYDQDALTAAHATLPLGSRVLVSLIGSQREVIVTINDRPGTRTRIIDLSRAAARELGILTRGVAMVTLTPL
ncbi:MAG: septal ring lytic transglycosylase RlpA family protein [Bryobacteraceae bacterium]|nr:septal ring lytic transglycosylase RlpA family protein [Bryobacteraceae bacterium]